MKVWIHPQGEIANDQTTLDLRMEETLDAMMPSKGKLIFNKPLAKVVIRNVVYKTTSVLKCSTVEIAQILAAPYTDSEVLVLQNGVYVTTKVIE